MKARTAIPIATIFLLLGMAGWLNPEVVQEWFEEVRKDSDGDLDSVVVGIQDVEHWFVIVVDFSDEPSGPGRDIDQARGILSGSSGAQGYIEQMTAGASELHLSFHTEVIRAALPSTSYGKDSNGERDVGDIEGGPAALAAQVIEEVASATDWEDFDLNGDSEVDRLLILHTARPQEDGSGATSRIWSHFGPLMDEIELNEGYVAKHYTMSSLRSSNNRGTIIHEVLHQVGGVDLYAVHDETVSLTWYGVGDWDIMASGNWNANGAVPAMPMAASMELLGLDRYDEGLEWTMVEGVCSSSVTLTSMSSGGDALRIPVSKHEYVWMEVRSDDGFDTRLPGHGLLVSLQDVEAGNLESNVVNHDRDNPWLKIIEADGGDDMLRAADKGSNGDLFQNGSVFGSEGLSIRDSHGRLVRWVASVSESNDTFTVSFTRDDCGEEFEVIPPEGGVRILPGEDFRFDYVSPGDCQPEVDLRANDGRIIEVIELDQSGSTGAMILEFNEDGGPDSKGVVSGTIGCGETVWDLQMAWSQHANRVQRTLMEADASTEKETSIEIPLVVEGDGQRQVKVHVEGALERIAEVDSPLMVEDGAVVKLTIKPAGLLVPGMLARGEVILVDDLGMVERIDVEVTGENIAGSAEVIRTFRDPSTLSLVVCSLAALWVLLGIEKRQPEVEQVQVERGYDDFISPSNIPEGMTSSAEDDSFHRQI